MDFNYFAKGEQCFYNSLSVMLRVACNELGDCLNVLDRLCRPVQRFSHLPNRSRACSVL